MDFYHLLNRGVDGRALFLDSQDYARFVHDLFEFNDTKPANNTHRLHMNDIVSRSYEREQIVQIHGWCLMKNHYHLLLSENSENGISDFIRKLNVGYAKYFNKKYERIGTLFQGRTKKILIEEESQFNYILHYIHLNPLDYLKGASEWRIRSKGSIENTEKALEYLKKYRWSSYLDYIDEQNFPSVLTTSFFKGAPGSYATSLEKYLKGAEQKQKESDSLVLE